MHIEIADILLIKAYHTKRQHHSTCNMAPQFSNQQRHFIMVRYHQTHRPHEVRRLFRIEFPNANRTPSVAAIYKIVNKLSNHSTLRNRNSEASGRSRSGRSQQNIGRVRRALQRDPNITSRNNPLPDISQATFNRITRIDLRWHPYKMVRRHALRQGDYARRTAFCQWLDNRPDRFFRETFIVDEANFYMNGMVNTQTVRCYAPKATHHRTLLSMCQMISESYQFGHVSSMTRCLAPSSLMEI